jgi:hypothetical protein
MINTFFIFLVRALMPFVHEEGMVRIKQPDRKQNIELLVFLNK